MVPFEQLMWFIWTLWAIQSKAAPFSKLKMMRQQLESWLRSHEDTDFS